MRENRETCQIFWGYEMIAGINVLTDFLLFLFLLLLLYFFLRFNFLLFYNRFWLCNWFRLRLFFDWLWFRMLLGSLWFRLFLNRFWFRFNLRLGFRFGLGMNWFGLFIFWWRCHLLLLSRFLLLRRYHFADRLCWRHHHWSIVLTTTNDRRILVGRFSSLHYFIAGAWCLEAFDIFAFLGIVETLSDSIGDAVEVGPQSRLDLREYALGQVSLASYLRFPCNSLQRQPILALAERMDYLRSHLVPTGRKNHNRPMTWALGYERHWVLERDRLWRQPLEINVIAVNRVQDVKKCAYLASSCLVFHWWSRQFWQTSTTIVLSILESIFIFNYISDHS